MYYLTLVAKHDICDESWNITKGNNYIAFYNDKYYVFDDDKFVRHIISVHSSMLKCFELIDG